jgi:hypothetical protein
MFRLPIFDKSIWTTSVCDVMLMCAKVYQWVAPPPLLPPPSPPIVMAIGRLRAPPY